MKQARVFIFITSLLLIGSLNAADPALSLTELLKTAGERNPDVLSAYQKWKAAGNNAGAASVWPNPRLSFTDEKDLSG
jgi:outer membrane protein TolC